MPRFAERAIFTAGQQGSFSARAVSASVSADELSSAWTQGMVIAKQMKLGALIAELNRYRPRVLRCDPEVSGYASPAHFLSPIPI